MKPIGQGLLSLLAALLLPPATLSAAEAAAGKTVATPPADKARFFLVLLAGQSNMAGRGPVDPADNEPHPRVLMLDRDGDWVPAVDPVHYDKKGAGVGPGRAFARKLVEADETLVVGLIPTACGGSPISVWEPGRYFDQTDSHPYDDALARTRRALRDGTLGALLWHQGESDKNDKNSAAHHDRLRALLLRFRADLEAPDLPIVIGQLGTPPPEWAANLARVDAAHRAMTRALPRVAFARADGLKLLGDNLHFDTPSQREFGLRYYDAYQRILKGENIAEPADGE